jgi:hypothetical protein
VCARHERERETERQTDKTEREGARARATRARENTFLEGGERERENQCIQSLCKDAACLYVCACMSAKVVSKEVFYNSILLRYQLLYLLFYLYVCMCV